MSNLFEVITELPMTWTKSYCHVIKQVSCQKASASYLKEVKRSHFVSSDKVHICWFLPNPFHFQSWGKEKASKRKQIYMAFILSTFWFWCAEWVIWYSNKWLLIIIIILGLCKVVRLMDEVESIFTKHFANNDRKKAMKFLRPQQHKDSHMVTFLVGNIIDASLFVSP